MTPALGLLAAAGVASAFVVEHLCSRRGRLSRAAGVLLGTIVSIAAAIILLGQFGNHMAPRMPGVLPIAVWAGVALAPLVAVVRGKERRVEGAILGAPEENHE